MPARVVRIVHRIHALGIYWVFDVEQNSIAGARACRQPDGRIHRDVVAPVGVLGLLRALPAMSAAVIQAVDRACSGVNKYPGAGHHFRLLRRRHRDFDHLDAKQCCIRVFVRLFTGASSQFFRLAHKRCAGDVDINIVFVVGINHQGMGV